VEADCNRLYLRIFLNQLYEGWHHGKQFKHVLLDQMFVDNKYQERGIGKELFYLAVESVKEWGVDKFYICAGSSEGTLGF